MGSEVIAEREIQVARHESWHILAIMYLGGVPDEAHTFGTHGWTSGKVVRQSALDVQIITLLPTVQSGVVSGCEMDLKQAQEIGDITVALRLCHEILLDPKAHEAVRDLTLMLLKQRKLDILDMEGVRLDHFGSRVD